MANRMFKPLGGSLTQEVICLTGKVTLLADGTCDFTNGSVSATMDDTSGISAGDGIFGTGVAPGTTVASVDSATAFTLSAAYGGNTASNVADIVFSVNSGNAGFTMDSPSASGVQGITLTDKYNSLLGVDITYVRSGSHSATKTTGFELVSEDVSGAGTISIQHIGLHDGDIQTSANMSGKVLHCMIWLKNSSV